MPSPFKLTTNLKPQGDQPEAIRKLVEGLESGKKEQVLIGVTGSGKTFVMANVIAQIGKPALVISHNKTLAAQLYSEFKELFPENAVEYFVSYYDYYQPEAYIPQTDTYIEKDASINDDLDRLRLAATSSILSREDVIVVSSVSCIYGLGAPEDWQGMLVQIETGQKIERDDFLSGLIGIQYQRNETQFKRGTFRVRGNTVDFFPSYGERPYRIQFSGDQITRIALLSGAGGQASSPNVLIGDPRQKISGMTPAAEPLPLQRLAIYPAKHFVTPSERLKAAMKAIEEELVLRVKELIKLGKDIEAKRLESRTRYDLAMLREVGYCAGVENYSRHLSGRAPGSKPYTLLDYFTASSEKNFTPSPQPSPLGGEGKIKETRNLPSPPRRGRGEACLPAGRGEGDHRRDFLVLIDESHQTIPQIRGMYQGDYSRKKVLVEHGFRLPSAIDNRPLQFAEFERSVHQLIYVSATPGPYEMERADQVVEQVIRPTGLTDPVIDVRPTEGQIDDLIKEIKARAKKNERVLVTTLTKRMAEDLSRYLKEAGIRVHYLHSEFDAFERVEILRDLRLQKYDAIVGINLLREGLDLPEVSLVAILDADHEGFLRSAVSLIQIAGRAARHINGKVIMYADKMTDSMKNAISETKRRRTIQEEFNAKHGITPASIQKEIKEGIEKWKSAEAYSREVVGEEAAEHDTKTYIAYLYERMMRASSMLDFERAAKLRDEIKRLEAEHGLAHESRLQGRKASLREGR